MERIFIDQVGSTVSIPSTPTRIISLVPSQTELLFDLGLDKEVVGITKFCVHPEEWLGMKQTVGGTKHFWFDRIDQLQPDLIIGNKEENYLEGIERLQTKYPVWISDVITFDDSLDMIRMISEITGKKEEGFSLVSKVNSSFEEIEHLQKKRALYLIWCNPWLGAAGQTFIHTMMEKAGFVNVLRERERYPELSIEDIRTLNPEVILLSSEPFPFKEEHAIEMKALLPNAEIKLVDGELFSWYGSRLIKAPAYFNKLRA